MAPCIVAEIGWCKSPKKKIKTGHGEHECTEANTVEPRRPETFIHFALL